MQLHTLKPVTKNKPKMIVGRGGRRGKTAGRGTKGQNARAGHKKRPEMRDFIKRIPKLRGRGVNSLKGFEIKPFVINIGDLEATFAAGDTVSPATLIEKKLVSTVKGKVPQIKLLGTGDLTKKLTVTGCLVSKAVQAKIEKAGGSVKK
ncbi:MAG: 50S ribosomal protein L15 [Candidatus Taylorbacteria bacterium]|nr:50S ribosomal protein L15 [Candidatus Taylorbacteria bacterium]